MKTLLHKLLQGKTKWNFQKADLTEKTEALKNPARGWYEIYPFEVEKKPDFKELIWCLNREDTIALVLLDIGAYRERELDKEALGNIRSILRFFAENQYDVVLRAVYDRQGKALEREPFFFEQVRTHLKQLMPVVKEFEKNVFVFQGMLVGSWGEMHTSRFLAPTKLKEMWSIQQKEAGDKVYFAVRKPMQWRMLHPESCGMLELACDKMGLFDDAIFGSENHLGTFGEVPKETAGWEGHWRKEDELHFEEQLCRKAPNGGEAVCGEQYPENGNVADTIDTLKKMHITYLNRTYDEKILNLWKKWSVEETGVWQKASVYDYVGNHLGYRFVVMDAEVLRVENSTSSVMINIIIENVGFANFYQEAEVRLEWVDENGNQYVKKVECDMRTWECGSTQTIGCKMELINCKLYLSAKRKQDGRTLYFANQSDEGGRVLLGQMKNVMVR